MKTNLLIVAVCTLIAALSALPAHADATFPSPYGINDAYQISTDTVSVELQGKAKPEKKGLIIWTIMIWGRTSGGTEISADAGTATFGGEVEVFGDYTAAEIYDALGRATIAAGISRNWLSCGGGTGITLASCVTRGSSGFSVSGTNVNRREYSYSCSTVNLAGVDGTFGCGTGMERTWVGSGIH